MQTFDCIESIFRSILSNAVWGKWVKYCAKKQFNWSPTYKYNLQLINMAIMEVIMPYESNDEKRIWEFDLGLPWICPVPSYITEGRLQSVQWTILYQFKQIRPRTPSIVKGNKSLKISHLVWFKRGSQWWAILKHFPQSRCILISHWSREK